VLDFLRLSEYAQAKILIDLTAVHYLGKGYAVCYQFLSVETNTRFCIEVMLSEDDAPRIPSISHLYPNAVWYERECFDMFGILFIGCSDLRRILTDYGFEGHPLRKDFPVSGFVEMRYAETDKRVISEPISLAQGFRSFSFQSPWK